MFELNNAVKLLWRIKVLLLFPYLAIIKVLKKEMSRENVVKHSTARYFIIVVITCDVL